MADDPTDKGPADRARISMEQDHEVRYWTEQLGVTRAKLESVIRKVGNSVSAVRKELRT